MKNEKMEYIFDMGEFFRRVQMEGVFPDSKTFVDCIPTKPLSDILVAYETEKTKQDFDLKVFVHKYFQEPPAHHSTFVTQENVSIVEHIDHLWNVLTTETGSQKNSLIPLPHPYVVPGGRFRELFYWDTYFTMLGLQISGRYDLIENMVENFAWLIDQYGYIPNGNRSYFLTRSQPPFFVLMIDLLAGKKGESIWEKYLPYLKKEYAFWMKGKDQLTPGNNSAHRVAMMEDGSIMNHYWDESNTARPEAFKKDIEWSKNIEDKENFFRHERAACESGWDFSSRWFLDGKNIATNRCADLIAVDLNCLLYYLELRISEKTSSQDVSKKYGALAEKRKSAIEKYCWNNNSKYYFDYDFKRKEISGEWTIAASYPLFFKICSPGRAADVARVMEEKFLESGGLLTTLTTTGQQWDAPNGWAPLEWMAIRGLANYGQTALAEKAATRWMQSNKSIFKKNGKLMEKYNVKLTDEHAVAGTYPTQDGFGWTNGVYLACNWFIGSPSRSNK